VRSDAFIRVNSPSDFDATCRFVFELPNNEATLLPVASCIVVRASDPESFKDAKDKPIVRPYTPISSPDLKGELVLLIKRYENGNMSKYIHSLKVSYLPIAITTDIIIIT
jgi:cytochrome-b5 reductase